ncbi:hypothetical protein [Fluviicola chungangensis]|uniref:Response regulator n=1 Tax=Fluviicola chungangensis TaxID=2597671 RepID=A0A556MGB6_9FLAO|nr:hypothetical protein [Fluviicola chungangensis]TSJ38967.1 hypothetical protein FO442_18295 [Fluviicola chungangensis]
MDTTYTIGYVDENEAQVQLFQRRLKPYGLNVIGYKIPRGTEFDNLMNQIYESEIDLLMIDYKLSDKGIVTFNGDKIESEFYEKKPLFPHIIFTSRVPDAEDFVEDWKIIFDKDDVTRDNDSLQRFVTTLKKSIEQYKSHIQKKKDTIKTLLEKGEREGLTSIEKDLLLKNQRDLQGLDRTKNNELPEQLISLDQLENISKVRREAEEFLKSLISKNEEK